MIDLDSALDSPLDHIIPAGQVVPSADSILMDQPGARIRLSHSTLSLLHGCERKFQLTKLLAGSPPREESPAMSFGKAYGAAAQLYMIMRSEGHSVQEAMDSAIWECYMQYKPLPGHPHEDDRRFLERAIFCIQAAQPFHERLLLDWEIPQFRGRYATELSFNLEIDETFYYVGYIDLVLKHRRSGQYAVTDYKTTSLRAANLDPIYRYGDQVLGYTVVLDSIAGSAQTEFSTNYWVAQLPSGSLTTLYEPKFHDLSFPKTLRDRMEWFLKVYLDVNYMNSLRDLNVYPKRGSNCQAYNRTCQFFGGCHITALDKPGVYVPDEIEYDFTFKLADIFQSHNQRLALE